MIKDMKVTNNVIARQYLCDIDDADHNLGRYYMGSIVLGGEGDHDHAKNTLFIQTCGDHGKMNGTWCGLSKASAIALALAVLRRASEMGGD